MKASSNVDMLCYYFLRILQPCNELWKGSLYNPNIISFFYDDSKL